MPSWQARYLTRLLRSFKVPHTAIDKVGGARPYLAGTRAFIRCLEPFIPCSKKGLRIKKADGAPVPSEWIEPLDAPPKLTVLFLHGGGYLLCSPRTHRTITTYFARHLPARVLVPDYRLAPAHPFPAALNDGLACYYWLREQGIPAEQIVLAGDSAGGGLVLGMMLMIRDAGEPLPAAAACFSPWTDLAVTGESIITNSKSDVWCYGESVKIAARLYLGQTPATNPLASPLYADLAGLPPLIIHASDSEVTRDDSVRFAAAAKAAGVNVQLKVWPGLPHVWQGFVPYLPEARESLDEVVAFLRNPD